METSSTAQHAPLVSIIMPAHNAQTYIREAIASILDQRYPHLELIIIDDASTDNTAQCVADFNDPRIRYYRTERLGMPSKVRNYGLNLAQGEFIGFLDADDIAEPDSVETLLNILLADETLHCAYGFAFFIDENSAPITQSNVLIQNTDGQWMLPPWYSHDWLNVVTGQISCLLAGLLVRKSTLALVGQFNETFYSAEDYEFYVRLLLHNPAGVAIVPRYVYCYRIHGDSLTKTPINMEKIQDSCLAVLQSVFDAPLLPEYVHQYYSLSLTHCFRYLARERLLQGQPSLARNLIIKALQHPAITVIDWLKLCLPLYLRSLLPKQVNQWVAALRAYARVYKK